MKFLSIVIAVLVCLFVWTSNASAQLFPLFPQQQQSCPNGQCYPAPVRQTANAIVHGVWTTGQGVRQAWFPQPCPDGQCQNVGNTLITNPPPQVMVLPAQFLPKAPVVDPTPPTGVTQPPVGIDPGPPTSIDPTPAPTAPRRRLFWRLRNLLGCCD